MTETNIPPFSQSEAREIRDALARTAPPSGASTSIETLVSRWRTLIGEMERGYRLTAYDYTNDLSIRDRLEEIGGWLSPELRSKVMRVVATLDARFWDASEDALRPLSDRPGSWWNRIPRKRDPEFDETM